VPLLVIAHRGASGACPENTLAAFRRAVEVGARMIELDVQLTRDGEVVVMHDWTLDRTTDGSGPVRERSRNEIGRLDAGSWFGSAFRGEPVPTLADVLAAIALPINVELKPVGDDGLESRALAIVEDAGAGGRVVFSSFSAVALESLRRISAGARVAVLWEGAPFTDAIELAERVGATALHVRKDVVGPEAVALARAARLPIRAWTVNDPGESARLAALGVEGIFTDFPERFLHIAGDE
jgi:glycerophosphoryl diester phosphodiesterase